MQSKRVHADKPSFSSSNRSGADLEVGESRNGVTLRKPDSIWDEKMAPGYTVRGFVWRGVAAAVAIGILGALIAWWDWGSKHPLSRPSISFSLVVFGGAYFAVIANQACAMWYVIRKNHKTLQKLSVDSTRGSQAQASIAMEDRPPPKKQDSD